MSFLPLCSALALVRAVSDKCYTAPILVRARAIPLLHQGRGPMGGTPANIRNKPNQRRRSECRRRMAA